MHRDIPVTFTGCNEAEKEMEKLDIEVGDVLYGPNSYMYTVIEVRPDGSFLAEADEFVEGIPETIDMNDYEVKSFWVSPSEVFKRFEND